MYIYVNVVGQYLGFLTLEHLTVTPSLTLGIFYLPSYTKLKIPYIKKVQLYMVNLSTLIIPYTMSHKRRYLGGLSKL